MKPETLPKDRWEYPDDVKYWSEGIKVILKDGSIDWFDPIEQDDWHFSKDKLLITSSHTWEFNRSDVENVYSYSLYKTENGYERFIHETNEWE
jgi:hypothetical protein